MDQDETWRAGKPQPWPHCVRWGPCSPSPKGYSPQFSAHICCGQMVGRIKLPLSIEVGLGQGNCVLDWDPVYPEKSHSPTHAIFGPCLLWPNGWMDEDALGTEVDLCPGHMVRKGHGISHPIFSAHIHCGHGRPSQPLLSSCFVSIEWRIKFFLSLSSDDDDEKERCKVTSPYTYIH